MTFAAIHVIGGNISGDIIFYIDETGQHGLVCAPSDLSTNAIWGCSGITITGADGTAVGTGNQNTLDIINGCSVAGIAAKICYDLDLNGYTDWFLPSKDELNLMYTNLKVNGLGGFANTHYWSSSEKYGDDAWVQYFLDGNQNYNTSKSTPLNVRAIRTF